MALKIMWTWGRAGEPWNLVLSTPSSLILQVFICYSVCVFCALLFGETLGEV